MEQAHLGGAEALKFAQGHNGANWVVWLRHTLGQNGLSPGHGALAHGL